MSKIFLYIGVAALLLFVVNRQFFTPDTWEPFVDACLKGPQATLERCECLSDYVHEQLSAQEVHAVMEHREVGQSFQNRVAEVVRVGSLRCL